MVSSPILMPLTTRNPFRIAIGNLMGIILVEEDDEGRKKTIYYVNDILLHYDLIY